MVAKRLRCGVALSNLVNGTAQQKLGCASSQCTGPTADTAEPEMSLVQDPRQCVSTASMT
jgi:hypothetical protein